jgi:putative sterol carrier protein
MPDADDLAAAIRTHERALRALGYRVRFDLTDTAEQILLDATGGTVEVTQAGGEADTVLALSSDDLARLIAGRLNPTLAYATGRLKIEGSRGVALKLAGLLDGE